MQGSSGFKGWGVGAWGLGIWGPGAQGLEPLGAGIWGRGSGFRTPGTGMLESTYSLSS